MKAKRKLKNVVVDFISLVHRGANRKTIIYKAGEDGKPPLISIRKVDTDKHLVYGIVYSPDEVDSQGDFAPKEVIREMAYNFMKEGKLNNIDRQHNYKAGYGFLAESWLTKINDPVFPEEREGSWAVVIKVEDDNLWNEIKEGKITGLSMAGEAETDPVPGNPGGEDIMKMFSDFKCFFAEKMETAEKEYSLLKARIENIENISGESRQLLASSDRKPAKQNIWF
jgi:hypothetical protein